jgi:hypothetical protein
MRFDLPSAARNPISLIGVAITTAAAVVFLALLALELSGQIQNPYLGLVLFIAVPAVLVFGLLLMPVGVWRQHRRIAQQRAVDEWPVIDLRLPRTRSVVFSVALLTLVSTLTVTLAADSGVHYMEGAEFCGTTCHTTMGPEWKSYQVSPHAEVACVSCHVGPGAGALIESKVAGTVQLWKVMTDTTPKPIPGAVHSMRPARETCQTCHWNERDIGDKLRQVREYADDEKSTETLTTLQLHVGGGRADLKAGSGIHWHMNINNRIEFVATDPERQTIAYVRFTNREGEAREYFADDVTPEQIAQGERRNMDCMDCHNRPAHTFDPTPERGIDNAIARRQIPTSLPFTRKEAVAAVKDEYPSTAAALAGIEARLRKVYQAQSADPALAGLVAGVQDVYGRHVFPEMNVKWGTYPNNIGHMFFQGCFRCHTDTLKTKAGQTINQDCESCHAMP